MKPLFNLHHLLLLLLLLGNLSGVATGTSVKRNLRDENANGNSNVYDVNLNENNRINQNNNVNGEEQGSSTTGHETTTENSLFPLWPPPPSVPADCHVSLDSCLSQGPSLQNSTVAVSLICSLPKDASPKVTTLLMNRTEYLRIAVDHQRQMALDFCTSCRLGCDMGARENENENENTNDIMNGNDQYNPNANNNNHFDASYQYSHPRAYRFVDPKIQNLTVNDPSPNYFFYDCQACLNECHKRDTLSADVLVETESYSSCTPLYDHEGENTPLFGGPYCEADINPNNPRRTIHLGVFDNPQCGGPVLDSSLEEQIRNNPVATLSNAMWDTIITQTMPLPCVETSTYSQAFYLPPEDFHNYPRYGWCRALMEHSIATCANVTTEDHQQLCEFSALMDHTVPTLSLEDWPVHLPIPGKAIAPYYDLTGLSVQYKSCQTIASFNPNNDYEDDMDAVEEAGVSISNSQIGIGRNNPNTTQYVTFQMCLGAHQHYDFTFSSNNQQTQCFPDTKQRCQDYVLDLETYLRYTARHLYRDVLPPACDACETHCDDNTNETSSAASDNLVLLACDFCMDPQKGVGDSNVTDDWQHPYCWEPSHLWERYSETASTPCDFCQECSKLVGPWEHGYVGAYEFDRCQMIYDPEDDDETALYAGPVCNNDDEVRVKVFLGKGCHEPADWLNAADYLMDGDGNFLEIDYASFDILTHGKPLSCYYNTPLVGHDKTNGHARNEVCEDLLYSAFACQDGRFYIYSSLEIDGLLNISDPNVIAFYQSLCPPGSN